MTTYFPKCFISLRIYLDIQVYKQIYFKIFKYDNILVQTSRILMSHMYWHFKITFTVKLQSLKDQSRLIITT